MKRGNIYGGQEAGSGSLIRGSQGPVVQNCRSISLPLSFLELFICLHLGRGASFKTCATCRRPSLCRRKERREKSFLFLLLFATRSCSLIFLSSIEEIPLARNHRLMVASSSSVSVAGRRRRHVKKLPRHAPLGPYIQKGSLLGPIPCIFHP